MLHEKKLLNKITLVIEPSMLSGLIENCCMIFLASLMQNVNLQLYVSRKPFMLASIFTKFPNLSFAFLLALSALT